MSSALSSMIDARRTIALLIFSMAVRPTAFCSSPYKNADAAKNADAGASAFLRRA
jgi:hypothetical protein